MTKLRRRMFELIAEAEETGQVTDLVAVHQAREESRTAVDAWKP